MSLDGLFLVKPPTVFASPSPSKKPRTDPPFLPPVPCTSPPVPTHPPAPAPHQFIPRMPSATAPWQVPAFPPSPIQPPLAAPPSLPTMWPGAMPTGQDETIASILSPMVLCPRHSLLALPIFHSCLQLGCIGVSFPPLHSMCMAGVSVCLHPMIHHNSGRECT